MALKRKFDRGPKDIYTNGTVTVTASKVTIHSTSEGWEFTKDDMAPELWTLLQTSKPKKVKGEDPKISAVISADGDRLKGVYPFEGKFFVKCVGLLGGKNGPQPYTVPARTTTYKKNGKDMTFNSPEHREFKAILKVTSLTGSAVPFDGWTILYPFWYLFEQEFDGSKPTGNAYIFGRSREMDALVSFLTAIGMDVEDEDFSIPYSDNILPWIAEQIPSEKKASIFQVTLEKGFGRGILLTE